MGNVALRLPAKPCRQSFAAARWHAAVRVVWRFAGRKSGYFSLGARLAPGAASWSEATKLSDDPQRSEQNPVLFQAPDGVLWLLWTAQHAGNQDTAIVRYRQSRDGGKHWGAIATLLDEPGTFIRQPISVMPNGNWLLPVFYCRTRPGRNGSVTMM